jgi:N-methylhydantoinase A
VLSEFEAGSAAGSGTGLTRGSGYPVLAPVMDLVEVGAGGGSVAWIDSGGLMRVGPASAGADPGPASYEKGGTEPTVTDANLVLGRLNPDYFLGGEVPLNQDAAREAIGSRCAQQLGIGVVQAALGIVDIADATMVEAMRLISVQRGYDPRDFALVATGGAGPAHANRLAQELGVSTVIVPPSPGVASALGMLVTDLRRDYRVTRLQPVAGVRVDELNAIFEDFEADAAVAFARQGLGEDQTRVERYLDVRYVGQSWNLQVTLPTGRLTDKDVSRLKGAFDEAHEQRYGYRVPEEPVEIVSVGLSATGLIPKPKLREVPHRDGSAEATPKATRRVYFNQHDGSTKCSVFDRYSLRVEDVVVGPAVIEEIDATTVVYPGYLAEVAPYGVLLIKPLGSDQRLGSDR